MSNTTSRSLNFLDFDVYLCSDDADFSNKSEEVCHFFKKCGYPVSVVDTAQHRTQQINQSTVSTANVTEGKEQENSIYAHLSST